MRGVVAVVQPHRYTRLASLFEDFCTCFNDADTVIVAPVYTAGEQPIDALGVHATAGFALDGVAIGDAAIPSVNGALNQPTPLLFGVYAFDQPFPEGCVAYVDDVVVEPG